MHCHHLTSRAVLVSSLFGFAVAAAQADVLTVSPAPGVAQYQSIQAAVDDAQDGDVVILGPGVYTSDHPWHVVNLNGKAITLVGGGLPHEVIIDGEGQRAGIACVSGEASTTTISDLMVVGAPAMSIDLNENGVIEDVEWRQGSGLLCWYASPVVSNCVFTENVYGMKLWGSEAVVRDCNFAHNERGAFARIDADPDTPAMTNVLFERCVFSGNEEGVHHCGGYARINDCVFEYNSVGGVLVMDDNQFFPGPGIETELYVSGSRFHTNGTGGLPSSGGILMWFGQFEVDSSEFTYNQGGAIRQVDCSTSSIHDSVFLGNTTSLKGGAVAFNCGGELSVANCTFMWNHSTQEAGAVYMGSGQLDIDDSYFEENQAPLGGAVSYKGGDTQFVNINWNYELRIDGSQFVQNTASNVGGAVHAVNTMATLQSNAFLRNSATGAGGAIYIDNANMPESPDWNGDYTLPEVIMSVANSVFERNSSQAEGGAIATRGAHVQLDACRAEENEAARGGAISVEASAQLTAKDCDYFFNTASSTDGGALFTSSGSELKTERCVFTENYATEMGGAVTIDFGAWTDQDSNFLANQCGLYGGAIECKNMSMVNLHRSKVHGGHLVNATYGGGIDIDKSNETAMLFGVRIEGCAASVMGGGLYSDGMMTQLVECVVTGNHCVSGGGLGSNAQNVELANSTVCGNTDDQIADGYVDLGGNQIAQHCCPGDFNSDGLIDGADLTQLLSSWGMGGGPADINHDGLVNGMDLTALLAAWGECL